MWHPHLLLEQNNTRCTWKLKQGELRRVPGGQEVFPDGCRKYSEVQERKGGKGEIKGVKVKEEKERRAGYAERQRWIGHAAGQDDRR